MSSSTRLTSAGTAARAPPGLAREWRRAARGRGDRGGRVAIEDVARLDAEAAPERRGHDAASPGGRRSPGSCAAWICHDVVPVCHISRRSCHRWAAMCDTSGYDRREDARGCEPHDVQRLPAISAPGRIRTCDLALRRRALYPLSYGRGRPQCSRAPLPAAAVARGADSCRARAGAARRRPPQLRPAPNAPAGTARRRGRARRPRRARRFRDTSRRTASEDGDCDSAQAATDQRLATYGGPPEDGGRRAAEVVDRCGPRGDQSIESRPAKSGVRNRDGSRVSHPTHS